MVDVLAGLSHLFNKLLHRLYVALAELRIVGVLEIVL